MKHLLGSILKHATALSWSALVLAWAPLVALVLISWESYARIAAFLLLAAVGVLLSLLGVLLGLAAVATSRKRWSARGALLANVVSLVWLLAVFL